MMTAMAEALAAVLDLNGRIPWDATELLADHTAPPVAPIGLVLQSTQLSESDLAAAADQLPEGVDIDLADAIEHILYAEEDAEALAALKGYADG